MTEMLIPQLPSLQSSSGPAVSVVMPTCRRFHQIGDTIKSLLMQTWTNFELLVRDDGDGTDGTAEAVAVASKGDPRVRYHRNVRTLGMPGNLNAGIMDSRGTLIAVCHDHDMYKPSFLAKMVDTLARYPKALFVHCAIDVITQNGTYVRSHVGDWPEVSPGHSWLEFMLGSFHCPVCALTLVRRDAHEKYGLYDSSFGFIADIEMWMRLALNGDVAYIREPLIQVREREEKHWATANEISLVRTAVSIHRRYIPHAYNSPERVLRQFLLELRLVHQVLRIRASWIKRLAFHKLKT
jgi:glycosyltransferase involved in cell wall biosynthesis